MTDANAGADPLRPTIDRARRLAEAAEKAARMTDPSPPPGHPAYGPWPHRVVGEVPDAGEDEDAESGEVFDAGEDADWPERREAVIAAVFELRDAMPPPMDTTSPEGWGPDGDRALWRIAEAAEKILRAWGIDERTTIPEATARLAGVRLVVDEFVGQVLTDYSHRLAELVREREGPPVAFRDGVPGVTVFGRPKDLNRDQIELIRAMLAAGPEGLSKPALERVKSSARAMLRGLAARDRDWKTVIHMPGKTRMGNYRININAKDPGIA